MKVVPAALTVLALSALCHHAALKIEKGKLHPIGKLVKVNGHKIHIYQVGVKSKKPSLVFLSGGGTVSPVYDFKPLTQRLMEQFHIIIVEKAGYGYSDTCPCDRGLDMLLEETRAALALAGETAPYVLIPHSMSGLEALYWAQKYPDEVKAIIGLDMAAPEAYQSIKVSPAGLWLLYLLGQIGIQRLPFLNVVDGDQLTEEEYRQARYLAARNFCNIDCILEGKAVSGNAEKVGAKLPETDYLLFSSNGKEIGKFWTSFQRELSAQTKGELVTFDCGHYLHHFEAEAIAGKITSFVDAL